MKIAEDAHYRIAIGSGLEVLKNSIYDTSRVEYADRHRVYINGEVSRRFYYHMVILNTLTPVMVGPRVGHDN